VALLFNGDYANDCFGAIVEKYDYHSDDYAFYATDNLLNDTTVPGEPSTLFMGWFCADAVNYRDIRTEMQTRRLNF
jgi:hypothetical protein